MHKLLLSGKRRTVSEIRWQVHFQEIPNFLVSFTLLLHVNEGFSIRPLFEVILFTMVKLRSPSFCLNNVKEFMSVEILLSTF
jgi:hypothetical protein